MENGDIASIISKIVENPEFAGMVSEMRGGETKPSGDISKEMLDKLPEIMSMVAPMVNGGGAEKSHSVQNKPVPLASNPTPKKGKYDKARATKLMQALKPYLTSERAEIIDKCLSVMQLTDIVGALGGIDGLSGLLNIK